MFKWGMRLRGGPGTDPRAGRRKPNSPTVLQAALAIPFFFVTTLQHHRADATLKVFEVQFPTYQKRSELTFSESVIFNASIATLSRE
jgi:hypothetical protein